MFVFHDLIHGGVVRRRHFGSFWLGRRDDGWWQWTRRRRRPLLLLYRLIQGDNGFEPEQCIDGPAGKNGLTVPF